MPTFYEFGERLTPREEQLIDRHVDEAAALIRLKVGSTNEAREINWDSFGEDGHCIKYVHIYPDGDRFQATGYVVPTDNSPPPRRKRRRMKKTSANRL